MIRHSLIAGLTLLLNELHLSPEEATELSFILRTTSSPAPTSQPIPPTPPTPTKTEADIVAEKDAHETRIAKTLSWNAKLGEKKHPDRESVRLDLIEKAETGIISKKQLSLLRLLLHETGEGKVN